jgi:hypothetical protein
MVDPRSAPAAVTSLISVSTSAAVVSGLTKQAHSTVRLSTSVVVRKLSPAVLHAPGDLGLHPVADRSAGGAVAEADHAQPGRGQLEVRVLADPGGQPLARSRSWSMSLR